MTTHIDNKNNSFEKILSTFNVGRWIKRDGEFIERVSLFPWDKESWPQLWKQRWGSEGMKNFPWKEIYHGEINCEEDIEKSRAKEELVVKSFASQAYFDSL